MKQYDVPGVGLALIDGGQGRVGRRPRRQGARQAGPGRRGHALHRGLEHEGAHDAPPRRARGREEARAGTSPSRRSIRRSSSATRRRRSRCSSKHLVCACTGLPRQDIEWLFEYRNATPASALALLGTMQPTSKFGEVFQYSNLMAAAAGFIGGVARVPGQGARRRVRRGDADEGVRPARHEAHDVRLRAGPEGRRRAAARRRRGRQDRDARGWT